MEDFTAITTQEQFDTAIGERIKRERETLAKKYGDYGELQNKIADYEKQIGDLSKSAKDAVEKSTADSKAMLEKDAALKRYEADSVKTRIALELGVPHALASRLFGATEDEIRKDAQTIAQFCKAQSTAPPLKSSEPPAADSKKAALRAFTEQLTNKGE